LTRPRIAALLAALATRTAYRFRRLDRLRPKSSENRSITANQESNDMTSRRTFIKDASLLALATMAPFRSVFAAGNTTVGVIYVGARGDYGYNQAQASAAAIIKKLPNVKVVEEENVPETIAVQKTMEAMIEQDGATLDFRDLVRLLRSACAQDGRQVSERPVRALRWFVEAGQSAEHCELFWLYR
jgi:hypothetical protein